jgi:uncharacterized protein
VVTTEYVAAPPAPDWLIQRYSHARMISQSSWQTSVSGESLERVAEDCEHVGDFEVEISVVRGGSLDSVLKCSVRGDVLLSCQRCLSDFTYHVATESNIAVAANREQLALWEARSDLDVDVVLASDVENVLQLIEDEVLLELPFAPVCGQVNCQPLA